MAQPRYPAVAMGLFSSSRPDSRARAAVVIGYVRWLRQAGYYDSVAARVSPSLRKLMEEPPIRTAWVSAQDVEALMSVLEQVAPLGQCRRMGSDTTRDSILPAVRPMIEAALRRAGTSPAAIYERLPVMLSMVVPDQSVRWEPHGPRRGEALIGWPYRPCDATLEVWAGALEVGLELCGAKGTVTILGRPEPNSARFEIEWA